MASNIWHPKRVNWAQAYSVKPNFFSRILHHPQTIIAGAQAIEITLSSIGVFILAGHGFDATTLLVMGKVELFFLSVPMHLITLHLASRKG